MSPAGLAQVARVKEPQQSQRYSRRPHRQIWGRQIAESDPAHQWSQHLSPVYGFNVVGVRAAMQYRVGCLLMCLLMSHVGRQQCAAALANLC